jgi:glycosyltransferase involved in cell wall biosynthesis
LLTGVPEGERVAARLDRRDRIRVAAVMDTQMVSGPGRQLAALVPALREVGVDVRVIVFQNPSREVTPYRRFLEAAGVDHVVVPFRSRFDRALLLAFQAALATWDPDIVQTHSYRPTTLTWLLRRRGGRWRWIGFFHGTTNEDLKVRVYHWLDRRLLPAADRVVVMSHSQASRFAVCRNRVVQVYNAVVPVSPVAVPIHTQRLLDHVETLPRPRIGVVGRLSAEKGVDVMVDALAELRARGTDASLVLAGDGPERAALVAQASRLGLGDAVHFLGPVLPIEPLYPLLDVLVIPSRSEGLPNVLLEALRADLPVVSTRVGAVPEVLDGSGAGRTVPPGNANALAEAVAATLAEPAEAARDDRSAVVGRFSLEQRVEAHLQLYRDVLAGVVRC